jgi:hypothetical protein
MPVVERFTRRRWNSLLLMFWKKCRLLARALSDISQKGTQIDCTFTFIPAVINITVQYTFVHGYSIFEICNKESQYERVN